GLDISFFAIFMGMAALNLFFWLLAARREGVKIRALGGLLAPMLLMSGYILGLGLMYLFKFGENEGLALASYARYIKTGYVFWALSLLGEGIYCLNRHARRPLLPGAGLFAALLAAAVAASGLVGLLSRQSARSSLLEQAEGAAAAALVESAVPEDARVYILTQAEDGYEYYLLRYLLYPHRVNHGAFSVGEPFYEGDLWTVTMDMETWRETLLESYEYVLVYGGNDFLAGEWGEMFPEGLEDGSLYRVDKSDGRLYPAAPPSGS
ncbi:MAG: hypothetical protein Q4C13_07730, partial [Clostridia bacterium]|nr:hypothetical protein [Clostridia bacterium]